MAMSVTITRQAFNGTLSIRGDAGTVAQLLRMLTELGGSYNFLILIMAPTDAYVQFASAFGAKSVRCEAVSNESYDHPIILASDDEARLMSLGWEGPADPNFHRIWEVGNEGDRTRLAEFALQTLVEVYKWKPETGLDAQLNLE